MSNYVTALIPSLRRDTVFMMRSRSEPFVLTKSAASGLQRLRSVAGGRQTNAFDPLAQDFDRKHVSAVRTPAEHHRINGLRSF